MKQCYFTTDSIDLWAGEMLERLESLRRRHWPNLKRAKMGLLVLDMQRYFLQKGSHAYIPSAEAIVPRICELISAFSRQERPVFFTRHLNSPEDAGRMSRWWGELITAENPLSELIPQLDTEAGMIIPKSQYDAFYRTPLEEVLRERGVEQLAICGVMTHLCCETTARSAFVRGLEVLFTVDGTATYNEEFHRAALLNLAHGFAYPMLTEELIAALAKGNGT